MTGPHREQPRRAHLVALGVLGGVLFGYPLLAVFDVPVTVLGVPVLWAYLDAFRALHPDAVEHSWVGRTGDGYRYDVLLIHAKDPDQPGHALSAGVPGTAAGDKP